MTKAITSKKPANALDSRAAVFVEKVATGADPRDAAKLAGFADPARAAKSLLQRPAVQWEIHARQMELDLALRLKSRRVLSDLMDSPLVAATVKARIASGVLDREIKTTRPADPNRRIVDASDSDLEREARIIESELAAVNPSDTPDRLSD